MFTDDYYFLIPSNTTITSLGRITLNLKRTMWLPVTVTITKGTDVAEIDTFHNENNEQPSIVINILKPNRQFEVSVIYFNQVINNITLNTSDEEKNITIANTKVVDEKRQTIKLPYEITGFSQKNITFTYKKQTELKNYTIWTLQDFKTFDINYSEDSVITIYGRKSPSDNFKTLENNVYIPPYNFLNYIKQNYSDYTQFRFNIDLLFYCGYSLDEDVFITNVTNELATKNIVIDVAYNSTNKLRSQILTLNVEGHTYDIEITQQANVNGYYFNYDNNNIPAPLDYTKNLVYTLNIMLSKGFYYEVQDYNFNVDNVEKPYEVEYEKESGTNNIIFTIHPISPMYNYNKPYEQKIRLNLSVYGSSEEITKYERLNETIELSIDASQRIYADGSIEIDANKEIIGNITLRPNNATSMSIVTKPDWIDADSLIFDKEHNVIYLQYAEDNLLDKTRTGDIEVSFTRRNGDPYNTIFIRVRQEPTYRNVVYKKTYEDYYIDAKNDAYDNSIEIYTNNIPLYSGLFISGINLTDFSKYLFSNKTDIFSSKYVNLNLLQNLNYSINGTEKQIVNYIYDYSYNDQDNYNITEPRQVIDYYDPRQYVFESIYYYLDENPLLRIGVNDYNFEFTDIKLYNKYNVTFIAEDNETIRFCYRIKYGNREIPLYGTEYKQKCTNAKYAVYYMNVYGGWNWMLFEGNKQIKKYNNTFNTIVTNNKIEIPYKVQSNSVYELTSLYMTDEQSEKLHDLYISPIIYLHDLENNKLIRAKLETKTYTEKTFINQGRKYFTQNITLSEAKTNIIY